MQDNLLVEPRLRAQLRSLDTVIEKFNQNALLILSAQGRY